MGTRKKSKSSIILVYGGWVSGQWGYLQSIQITHSPKQNIDGGLVHYKQSAIFPRVVLMWKISRGGPREKKTQPVLSWLFRKRVLILVFQVCFSCAPWRRQYCRNMFLNQQERLKSSDRPWGLVPQYSTGQQYFLDRMTKVEIYYSFKSFYILLIWLRSL